MNKGRRVGFVFVVIGVVLMLSALLLFLHNKQESDDAGEAADAALLVIHDTIESNQNQIPENDPDTGKSTEEEIAEPTELTVMNIDGNNYVGYISIPNFELELPVLDGYGDELLRIAPCLQYGSPLTDDAVIAGHNYEKHFLPLYDVEPGEVVTFTDMNGYVIEYEAVEVKTIDPTSVYEVIDSEYDLILYTCTLSGRSRVIVCCDRLEHISR